MFMKFELSKFDLIESCILDLLRLVHDVNESTLSIYYYVIDCKEKFFPVGCAFKKVFKISS